MYTDAVSSLVDAVTNVNSRGVPASIDRCLAALACNLAKMSQLELLFAEA